VVAGLLEEHAICKGRPIGTTGGRAGNADDAGIEGNRGAVVMALSRRNLRQSLGVPADVTDDLVGAYVLELAEITAHVARPTRLLSVDHAFFAAFA
jgi:hypothetical protein